MHAVFSRFPLLSIVLIIGLFFAFRSYDDDFARRLIEQFRAYNRQWPTEKVYVDTDRDVYLTGETIWLKGYIFNGTTHEADTVSRVLYVDLVDPVARRVRLRAQLRATDGYAPGQFTIPDSLPAGTYEIRTFTNFMRNYPETFYFTKTLTILRPDGLWSVPKANAAARPDVQFLPESGQLVAGIESRVAFKAVSASGWSMPAKGFVLTANKDTVIGFSTTHAGMGYLTFKPEAGQTYTATVQFEDGTKAAYPLPAVQPQGVVMLVDNLSNKDNVRVYVYHNKTSTEATASLTLLAQTRGQAVQAVKIPLAKKTALVQLPRAEFPEGIAQLTLFDETNRPAAERLVFINKNERITVSLTTAKPTYKNREQVDLTVTTTDANGKPVAANLALSAVDARLVPDVDSNGTNIVSSLLLSSDLTGPIEQPASYFNPANADRWTQLDLLMMTQGWRRFAWKDVLTDTVTLVRYTAEGGLSLTGKVVRPNQKQIGGTVKLTFMLVNRDSSRVFLAGETNEAGNFAAYDLDFTDTTGVLIQGTKGAANRNLVITLDQLLTPTVTVTRGPYNPFLFQRDELAEFVRRTSENQEIERQLRRNGEILLQAVTVKARKQREIDSRVIYGTPDASVKFTQLNTSGRQTILDVIQGQVAGVQVTGNGFNARVQIRGAASFSGPVEPLFVLDGVPMDLQAILGISVQDVDRVDVLKGASAAIYGSRAGGGVISILTKRGGPTYDYTKDVVPGTLLAKLPGYTPVREFYALQYDVKKPEHNRPDYRTTLFWAPMIQTGADGKATVSFFTSDAKTTIRLWAEGATPGGMPGTGESRVRVE